MNTYREYFRKLDINGDGRLSKEEFFRMSQIVGLQLDSQQLNRVYAKADETEDGFITFREFMAAFCVGEELNMQRPRRQSAPTASNNRLVANANNNGRHSVVAMSDRPAVALDNRRSDPTKKFRDYFRDMDVNGDGKLSKEEFFKMSQKIGLNLDTEQLKKVYEKADETRDGFITFREFMAAFSCGETTGPSTVGSTTTPSTRKKSVMPPSSNGHDSNIMNNNDNNNNTTTNNNNNNNKFNSSNNNNIDIDKSSSDLTKMYRSYFRDMDVNGDGKLSKEEFLRMSQAIGLNLGKEHLERVYAKADETGDGMVTYREFVAAFSTDGRADNRARKASVRPERSSFRSPNKGRHQSTTERKVSSVTFHEKEERQENGYLVNGADSGVGTGVGEAGKETSMATMREARKSRSNDPMRIYRDCFDSMDVNKDGKLSQSEFVHMSHQIGLQLDAEQLRRVYSKADETGDGLITFREFVAAFSEPKERRVSRGSQRVSGSGWDPGMGAVTGTGMPDISEEDEGRMRSATRFFWDSDLDCDGRLDLGEFSRMLSSLGMRLNRRDMTKAFKKADSEGAGFVNFTNFVDVYLSATPTAALLTRDKIKEIFRTCDVQGKMFLDPEQFALALRMLGRGTGDGVGGRAGTRRLMSRAGTSEKNKVYYTEFCTFFGVK